MRLDLIGKTQTPVLLCVQVVRASRVLNRWERAIVMKMRYGLVRLILFLIIVLAIVHWLGCCMGFLLVVQEEVRVVKQWYCCITLTTYLL